ncbi:MAG TPA: hypothetical protein VGB17_16025 [Pyrinomonadaceae bacterium]|jgi:hypothetical protein
MNWKRKHQLRHFFIILTVALLLLSFASTTALADDKEFDAVTKHLKTQYKAKRVRIPFLGLASFAVRLVRPAGVKSFKVAIFEDLSFAGGMLDDGLNRVLRNALSQEWQPLVRVRSREGEQTYIYARDSGQHIKLMVVNIGRKDAVVLRVKVNPDKLSAFINNPKLLGISLARKPETREQ